MSQPSVARPQKAVSHTLPPAQDMSNWPCIYHSLAKGDSEFECFLTASFVIQIMDPLSAVSLAAAIVEFVQFGYKVAKRLHEYNSSNPADFPKSLQAICTQLPLLLNALERMKTEAQVGATDTNTRCVLRGVVAGCRAQIQEVQAIIDEIACVPGESLHVRMRKVLVSLKKDEKVWTIERNLQTYISVLVLHHVVDAADVPSQLPDETYYYDVRERAVQPFIARPRLTQALENALDKAARSLAQRPTICHLVGDHGSGKTQLALAHVQAGRESGQFKTVFWRDASSNENLCLGLESVAAIVRRSSGGSRQEKLDFVRSFLGDLWHPWLLVLDNHDPAEVDGIASFLPQKGAGAVILLSEAAPASGNVIKLPKFRTTEEQRQLDSLLGQAVQGKDVEGIKDLLSQGADVDTTLWGEWPMLHRAVLLGMEDVVRILLDRGAEPCPPSLSIAKPIFWAAEGKVSMVKLLLDHEDARGIYCKPSDYDGAFGLAAEKGRLDVAQLLLARRDIRLTAAVSYGQTALQLASKNGHVDIVKLLIDEGALNGQQGVADSSFLDATSTGHFETAKVLCKFGGADVNAKSDYGRTALYSVVALRDNNGKANGLELADFLLAEGADPDLQSSDGGPLHQAATYDHVDVLRLLLKHGADPTIDDCGWSPLSKAVRYNSPGAIDVLLEANIADQAKAIEMRTTALWVACRQGSRERALPFLEAGVDINKRDAVGHTPLIMAIKGKNVPLARLLVRKGARHDVGVDQGRLPLHLAAKAGFDILVRDLLRAGAPPDKRDGKGDTAMCLAAAAGHEKAVKQLLDMGASRDVDNKYGETPLDLAEEKGHKELVKMLEDPS